MPTPTRFPRSITSWPGATGSCRRTAGWTNEQNPVNATGLYLYDAFGNLNLLYRDPAISSECPIPVGARPEPPVHAEHVAWDGPQEGRFLLQDVYRGLAGVPRGTIKRLRIVAVPPKVQPQMNSPSLGVSAEDPGKFVLGTVPVEADGSAYFRVPRGVPGLLPGPRRQGLAVQTMRSLTYVQPGQTLPASAATNRATAAPRPAVPRGRRCAQPSKLTPRPRGSWPLRYDQLVQPVLDKNCISCHSRRATSPGRPARPHGRAVLRQPAELRRQGPAEAGLRARPVGGRAGARPQEQALGDAEAEKPHEGSAWTPTACSRLVTWMDIYAAVGHFSAKQEEELRQLRKKLEGMLEK